MQGERLRDTFIPVVKSCARAVMKLIPSFRFRLIASQKAKLVRSSLCLWCTNMHEKFRARNSADSATYTCDLGRAGLPGPGRGSQHPAGFPRCRCFQILARADFSPLHGPRICRKCLSKSHLMQWFGFGCRITRC